MWEAFWLASLAFGSFWGPNGLQGAPIPAQPWIVEWPAERLTPGDHRVPILPPIKPGERPKCDDPPDQQEILRALPRVARGVPYIYEEFRDDLAFKVEKLVDRVDPPRFFPLIGPAQLHHCHWKCTVTFTENIEVTLPWPYKMKRRRAEVIYIDRDRLYLCKCGDTASVFREMSGTQGCPAGFASTKTARIPQTRPERAPRVAAPDIIQIGAEHLVPKGPYILEPMEILQIGLQGTTGRYIISPEGFIDIGTPCGPVRVAGLTVNQAQRAIQKSLPTSRNGNVTIELVRMRGSQQIVGEHLVRPDGTIGLGTFGSVFVQGMTPGEVKTAIEKYLSAYLVEPQISVEVKAYNSRKLEIVREPIPTQAGQYEQSENEFAVRDQKRTESKNQMTISDVVRMAKKGISQEIIVRQMELTNAAFNLTVDDIIELHDQGVSEAIIRAMQER